MFGYLRFSLAFAVLLSHVGLTLYTLNPGVIAVVIFYILAGYVVSHLYKDIFSKKHTTLLSTLIHFYKNRLLRIFPLYLYVISITIIFLLITSYKNPEFTPITLLNNLSIIPLNYYMYIDSTILKAPDWWLIPPAWSLGTELQAYLLLPFALIFQRVKLLLAFASFLIYTTANFSILNPDYFGYRFIVGVFFIFLLGSAIQTYKKADKLFLLIIWTALFALLVIFTLTDSFSPTYTRETLIGLLLGIPLVLLLSKTKTKLPHNKLLGSFSYGIFLTHFLSLWILDFFGIPPATTPLYIAQISLLSLILAGLGLKLVTKNPNKFQ